MRDSAGAETSSLDTAGPVAATHRLPGVELSVARGRLSGCWRDATGRSSSRAHVPPSASTAPEAQAALVQADSSNKNKVSLFRIMNARPDGGRDSMLRVCATAPNTYF